MPPTTAAPSPAPAPTPPPNSGSGPPDIVLPIIEAAAATAAAAMACFCMRRRRRQRGQQRGQRGQQHGEPDEQVHLGQYLPPYCSTTESDGQVLAQKRPLLAFASEDGTGGGVGVSRVELSSAADLARYEQVGT